MASSDQRIVRLRDGYHVYNKKFKTMAEAQEFVAVMEGETYLNSPTKHKWPPRDAPDFDDEPVKPSNKTQAAEIVRYKLMLGENGAVITKLKAKCARAVKDIIKLQADLAFVQQACQTLVEENTRLKAQLGLEQTIIVPRRGL